MESELKTFVVHVYYEVPVEKLQDFFVAINPFGKLIDMHRLYACYSSFKPSSRKQNTTFLKESALRKKILHLVVNEGKSTACLFRSCKKNLSYNKTLKSFSRFLMKMVVAGDLIVRKKGKHGGGFTNIWDFRVL